MLEKVKALFSESKKGLLLVSYGLILFFILMNIGQFHAFILLLMRLLRPLFLGLGMAYIFNMPMSKIEKWLRRYNKKSRFWEKKIRSIAIALTLLLALALLVLMVAVVIPQLVQSLTMLFSHVGEYIGNILNYCIQILNQLNIDTQAVQELLSDVQTLPWDQILNNVLSWFAKASSSIGDVATGVFNQTVSIVGELGVWLTGFMASIYLLANKERHLYQARKLCLGLLGKEASKPIFYWAKRINQIFTNFIGGQLLEAMIIFVIYYVSMTVLRMPYALVISAMIAMTSIIPVFGAMIGSAVGFVLILAIHPWQAVFFYIFYQLMQQFENNVIYPRVVGNSVGLPGVWVLISILAFGSLYGVLGMFIAVPTSAVIYQAISALISYCLKMRHIQVDEQEFVKNKSKDEAS